MNLDIFQCSNLLQEDCSQDYVDSIAEEYDEIRGDHFANLKERKYVSLKEARRRAPVLDWAGFMPTRPAFLGTRVFDSFPLEELVPYIDWKPFFDVWQLRGKYPNSKFPKIFQDETVGEW